jgi:hypothetical protein
MFESNALVAACQHATDGVEGDAERAGNPTEGKPRSEALQVGDLATLERRERRSLFDWRQGFFSLLAGSSSIHARTIFESPTPRRR